MISGINYNKFCNWHVCPRYEQKFDLNLEDGDFLFLNLDIFEQFLNFITVNKPKNRFNLVTQNSDRNFTNEMFNMISPFIHKLFAINATFQSEKLVKIPIGFNDAAINHIVNVNVESNKDKLIYSNFKICHHPERQKCFDYFVQFEWVDFYMDGMNNVRQLPFEDFYNTLKEYKYCISPRGAGIDTHRIYECIYFGVIPIVMRNELSDLYENLPVLLVDDWSEIKKDYLEKNYNTLKNNLTNWVEMNPNWYKTEFWLK